MTRIERIKDAFTRVGDMWANYVVMLERSRNPKEDAEIYLGYFLADKSLTGARIADLLDAGYDPWIFDSTKTDEEGNPVGKNRVSVSHMRRKEPRDWGHGDDPDEAITELWRLVFIDTEN